ncbi:DUF5677 domain-containing protein [Streptomyces melanogenes]|uniref:DUF5677 domain-containing protein n=1 Tax=Streptomyces melanogenes TaxID=67326 RepID=UPI0037A87C4F
MDPEQSKLLRFALDAVNTAIANGEFTASDDVKVNSALMAAIEEAIGRADVLAPEEYAWFTQKVRHHTRTRGIFLRRVRRSHLKRWGRAFQLFDRSLSTAVVLNSALEDSIGRWITDDETPRPEFLLGVDGALGGVELKCLLLLSLQSRACSISHEIRLLVEHGFPEAVVARNRSLHELAVIAESLSHRGPSDTEVSDRYGAWTVAEARKDARLAADQGLPYEPLAGADAELERRAEATWGRDFFKQNGWASPLFPGRRPPIPFSDIEKITGMDHRRSYYAAGNEAIHAGPTALAERARFRNGSIFPTASEVQHDTVRNFLAVAAMTLSQVSIESCRAISYLTEDYDALFAVKPIVDAVDATVNELKNGGMRP